MAYLVDTSALVDAKRRYYGFDIVPAFWAWLQHQHNAGTVFSIEAVRDELRKMKDDLHKWSTETLGRKFFRKTLPACDAQFTRVSDWTMGGQQMPAAKDEFLNCADPLLVAHALAEGHTVVTMEGSAPESIKSIKIPDACRAFEVECIDTFEMMRRLKFVAKRHGP